MLLIYRHINRLSQLLLLALIVSVTLEGLQFILQIGIADIDDVILNVFGAMIGYFAAKGLLKLLFSAKFILANN